MLWDVEYTDEFEAWWHTLTEAEQIDITAYVALLEEFGTQLEYPYSSGINGSKHPHLRELRVQHRGKPYRVLYIFDPRRVALLLIGGNKTSDNRWYSKFIKIADRLYDNHIKALIKEGFIHD